MANYEASSVATPSNGDGRSPEALREAQIASQTIAIAEAGANKDREAIQKIWGIARVEDAFPKAIKPFSLGRVALGNLKAISLRVNNLAAAQALFLKEAKKDGKPVPFGFTHSKSILNALKANGTPNLTPNGNGGAKLGTGSQQLTHKSISAGPKTLSCQSIPKIKMPSKPPMITPKKAASLQSIHAPKLPELIAPSPNLRAPFSAKKTEQCLVNKAPIAFMAGAQQLKVAMPKGEQKVQSPIARTIPNKRPIQSACDDHEPAVKKARMEKKPVQASSEDQRLELKDTRMEKKPAQASSEDQRLDLKETHKEENLPSPEKAQHNEIAQKISVADLPNARPMAMASSKVENGSSEDGLEALNRLMAEDKIAQTEFMAASEASGGSLAADTIRVAHPNDVASQLVTGKEQFEQTSNPLVTKLTAEFRSLASLPRTETTQCLPPDEQPEAHIKEQCLKLPAIVKKVICADFLHELAGSDHDQLIHQVKYALDQNFKRLEADLEHIFDTAG